MDILAARLCEPGEHKLSQLIDAADWRILLPPDAVPSRAGLAARVAGPLSIVRPGKAKRRRGRPPRPGQDKTIDVHETLLAAHIDDDGALRVRVRAGGQGGARIREVVCAVLDATPPDAAYVRERLLTQVDDGFVAVDAAGPSFRSRAAAAVPATA
jgi:hypothetical protein